MGIAVGIGGWRFRAAVGGVLPLALALVGVAEPAARAATARQNPSREATNALTSFSLAPGFKIELAAAEPAVVAPGAMAFDENGRLFVAEMLDYPNGRNAKPHLGRIRLLEDPDGEGTFNVTTVFAEDLAWPSALACYQGGVFVAAAPDLIYLRDSKGNGVADVRNVVVTGFGGTNAPSSRKLMNSLQWGLDNRIHGSTAGLGGRITSPEAPAAGLSLEGADFSFDPRTFEFRPETGAAATGVSFDSRGRWYQTSLEQPLAAQMIELRCVLRNPFFARPPLLLNLIPAGAALYPAKGEGESFPGRFTAPSACTVYRGSAFPTNYLDNVFIADAAARVIHRVLLRSNGVEVVAGPAPGEVGAEFLRSTDPAFEPTQIVNGPDGCLYVADRRRGGGQGRIYRIAPANFQRPKAPALGKARTYDLVANLAQVDGWHRETAARLLFERADPAAAPLLADMLNRSPIVLARMHALRALEGLGALQASHVVRGLKDPDPFVRVQALQAAGKLSRQGVVPEPVWGRMRELVTDPSPAVRQQLALTLGEATMPGKGVMLARLARADFSSRWMQTAVLSSAGQAREMFSTLTPAATSPEARTFLVNLATSIGMKGDSEDLAGVVRFLAGSPPARNLAFDLVYALGEGLRRAGASLAAADPERRLQPLYGQALDAAIDDPTSEAVRLAAMRVLRVSPLTFAQTSDWLLLMCSPRPSPAIQAAAAETVAHYNDPGVLSELLTRWTGMAPLARRAAVAELAAKAERIPAILAAAESRQISVQDFPPELVNYLRTHVSPDISQKANRLFGPLKPRRPEAMAQFKTALSLSGVAARGRSTYQSRCASCHELNSAGYRFGPDLRTISDTPAQLLSGIVEPHAALTAGWGTTALETKSGEVRFGIIVEQDLAAVWLEQAPGEIVVWPQVNVRALEPQLWSLMPEGLEQGLSPQDMADLLEFLAGLAVPPPPAPKP